MNRIAQAEGSKRRITGIDAARGAALISMMITHLLPAWDEEYERTVSWFLFAGRGPALFALLAGVSLAFMSGGRYPPRGRQMTAMRYGLAVRAVLIAVVGMSLAYLAIYIQVILAYYAMMFLLALPLLRLRVRTLLILAGGIAVAAPFLMQGVRDSLPDMQDIDPNFSTLAADPGGVLGQVLLSGTYPALPWMAYICLGLALGRMDLTSGVLQIRLFVAGIGLAVGAAILSALLLGPLGGENRLVEATSEWSTAPQDTVTEILIWGPDPTLPTDTWWWLAALIPYSTTPVIIMSTAGTALAALGAILLIARTSTKALRPLALLGKMTLSLYSLHLVLVATGMFETQPLLGLVVQMAILLLFAYVWQRFTPMGPLERVMSDASKWVRNTYLGSKKAMPVSPRDTSGAKSGAVAGGPEAPVVDATGPEAPAVDAAGQPQRAQPGGEQAPVVASLPAPPSSPPGQGHGQVQRTEGERSRTRHRPRQR